MLSCLTSSERYFAAGKNGFFRIHVQRDILHKTELSPSITQSTIPVSGVGSGEAAKIGSPSVRRWRTPRIQLLRALRTMRSNWAAMSRVAKAAEKMTKPENESLLRLRPRRDNGSSELAGRCPALLKRRPTSSAYHFRPLPTSSSGNFSVGPPTKAPALKTTLKNPHAMLPFVISC